MNSDAPASAAVEATENTAPSRFQALLADLRQAGTRGQAQWLSLFESFRRSPVAEVQDSGAEAEVDAPSSEPVKLPLAQRLLDSPQVLRAQRKGASLLLGLAASVRAQAEQLEQGLKALGQPSEADAVSA